MDDGSCCYISGCTGSMVQKTYVPDDLFEIYLETNGMGDGIPLNDSVITSNINTIGSLSINNRFIYFITSIF